MVHTELSAIAEHVHSEDPVHEVEWNSMKVIDRAGKKIERKVREAMHIHSNKPEINRDGGIEHSSVLDHDLELVHALENTTLYPAELSLLSPTIVTYLKLRHKSLSPVL